MNVAVLGTDTGVGKTIITAGLVGALRREGYDARAVKPAQTGYPPDDDAGTVAKICNESTAAHCCRYLDEPLAPAIAADRSDRQLSFDALFADVTDALDSAAIGVLEGVGGVRVPVTAESELLDLVSALECPAIVVSRPALGTLNHTALTVEALQRRAIPVLGVVLNQFTGDTVAERTNPDALGSMIECPISTFPSVEQDAVIETTQTRLASTIDRILDHTPPAQVRTRE
ncbi:dethiobiotin synthase [Halocatena halophila]|uniref:dethiobiotin synthase n=1 Tax=Halocatena halophila TaxID=2814576 RepID=UPI002ED5DEAF